LTARLMGHVLVAGLIHIRFKMYTG